MSESRIFRPRVAPSLRHRQRRRQHAADRAFRDLDPRKGQAGGFIGKALDDTTIDLGNSGGDVVVRLRNPQKVLSSFRPDDPATMCS